METVKPTDRAFYSLRHSIQKSSSGDGKLESSHCMGGAITFFALFQQIDTIGVGVILS